MHWIVSKKKLLQTCLLTTIKIIHKFLQDKTIVIQDGVMNGIK